jgi:hypothetical protein
LENCDDNVDMNTAWKNIRENMKTSAKESLGHYELQQHKPWFDDECSKLYYYYYYYYYYYIQKEAG